MRAFSSRTLGFFSSLLACGLAGSTAVRADPAPPSVTAKHAFVGDPLFGLTTQAGTLFAKKADERTAIASTTKTMTLRLALWAERQGLVGMNDLITVSATAAAVGGSSMNDLNGNPLVAGELVAFKDLLRGMMYPSGNNAAWVIAETISRALNGPNATSTEFVALMNATAAADGLVDTAFTGPNGFDSGNTNPGTHYSTARELARIWDKAVNDDPRFLQITGFTGTYTFTTKAPGNKTKSYSYGWGGAAQGNPGWEGEKGGATPRCNGTAQGCLAVSARRMGRRVDATFMQGQFATDRTALLNWGFQQIFKPELRHEAVKHFNLTAHALACRDDGVNLVATLRDAAPPTLETWKIDPLGQTITELAESAAPIVAPPPPGRGGGRTITRDVQLARLSDHQVITATRIGPAIELQHYFIPQSGPNAGVPQLLESGVSAGTGTDVALVRVHAGAWATLVTQSDGSLKVTTWTFGARGRELGPLQQAGMTQVASTSDSQGPWKTVSAATGSRPDLGGQLHVVAALGAPFGAGGILGFEVDPVSLAVVESYSRVIGSIDGVVVARVPQPDDPGLLFQPETFVVSGTVEGHAQKFYFEQISGLGDQASLGQQGTTLAVSEAAISGFGESGMLYLYRSHNGAYQARTFDLQPGNGGLQALPLGTHDDSHLGLRPVACQLPSGMAAEGLFASATEKGGRLHLQGWRVGPRPLLRLP